MCIRDRQKTLVGITPPRPEKEKASPYKTTYINTPLDSPQNTLKRAPKEKQQPQQRQELENQKDVSDTSQQRDRLVDNSQEKKGGWKLEMGTAIQTLESKTVPMPEKEEATPFKATNIMDDPRIAQIAAKYR